MSEQLGITDVLEKVRDETDGEHIRVGEVIEHLESRGFGPLLMTPALIAFLPTGAIPGVPSVCGLLIALMAIQMVFGKQYPWLPGKLRNLEISRDRYVSAVEKAEPFTRRIDKLFRPRIRQLSEAPVSRIVALICALFGLTMIPLEVIPLAAAVPSLGIILASIGLSTRDGIVVIAALAVFSFASYILYTQTLS